MILYNSYSISLEFAEVIIVSNGFVDKINFECYPVYCRQKRRTYRQTYKMQLLQNYRINLAL